MPSGMRLDGLRGGGLSWCATAGRDLRAPRAFCSLVRARLPRGRGTAPPSRRVGIPPGMAVTGGARCVEGKDVALAPGSRMAAFQEKICCGRQPNVVQLVVVSP